MNETPQGLASIAAYSKIFADKFLEREFKGAQFIWSKEKAKRFAEVSIEDLLFDPYFLNGKKWLYPGIIDTILEYYEEKKKRFIEIVALLAGFGTGKTEGVGSVLNWLKWFEFTCKFDKDSEIACPQEYYHLKPTSMIAFIALSKTVKKSVDITFNKMRSAFDSDFNKDYFPVDSRIRSKIAIPGNNTVVFPNTATEAANAGYDIFSYVMDEISFLEIIDTSARSKGSSDNIYDQAKGAQMSAHGRMSSRFGRDGLGILLSSANYDEDFLISLIRRAYNGLEGERIFYKVLLPWETNPKKFYQPTTKFFYFDTEKSKVIVDKKKIEALEKYYVKRDITDIIFGDNSKDSNDELLSKIAEA